MSAYVVVELTVKDATAKDRYSAAAGGYDYRSSSGTSTMVASGDSDPRLFTG